MNSKKIGFVLLASCIVIADLFVTFSASGRTTELSVALPKILAITWKKGPDLPQGFQDSSGGILDNMLITVGGFCSGQTKGVVNKLGKYPRGFLRKVWALDLKATNRGWRRLPDFPATGRQCLSCIPVKNRLYCWGGFNYTAPFCYRDGYELSHVQGTWVWKRLPDLPWRVSGAGICSIGPRIYLMGGADYNRQDFFTNSNRSGDISRLGARLLVFNTDNKEAGWKKLPSCPGTPRWVSGVAAVKGKIYVIGGATGNDNSSGNYCTVVDNWEYNPDKRTWIRLPDTPIASGNFPSGRIVFQNRYILLVGGFQYKNVMEPSGILTPPFGRVFRHYQHNPYDSDVFVYDTLENKFGRADPLPLNNNMPMTVLRGNLLNLIGGETNGSVIGGEYFGHHPDLYLTGKLSLINK